jgi:flagellar biosynthetic protein FliP
MRIKSKSFMLIIVIFMLFTSISSATDGLTIPAVDIGISQANTPEEIATSVQLLLLLSVLSLAPSILLMMTPFTRIIIILSFLRRALSLQTTPPNQVLIGLALFLTFFIMAPIITQINEEAYVPFVNGEIDQKTAIANASQPLKEFMLKQVRTKDLNLFIKISKIEIPKDMNELPISVITPAFIISELKTSFEIGFILFIPFIVIDMVVSNILMALGMMMLPPVMISLPFKILLFIMIDGWNILIEKIIMGIR